MELKIWRALRQYSFECSAASFQKSNLHKQFTLEAPSKTPEWTSMSVFWLKKPFIFLVFGSTFRKRDLVIHRFAKRWLDDLKSFFNSDWIQKMITNKEKENCVGWSVIRSCWWWINAIWNNCLLNNGLLMDSPAFDFTRAQKYDLLMLRKKYSSDKWATNWNQQNEINSTWVAKREAWVSRFYFPRLRSEEFPSLASRTKSISHWDVIREFGKWEYHLFIVEFPSMEPESRIRFSNRTANCKFKKNAQMRIGHDAAEMI